jgi:hypothetical protein
MGEGENSADPLMRISKQTMTDKKIPATRAGISGVIAAYCSGSMYQ